MVFFKHKYLTNPTVTPADAILAAAADLASLLKGHHARHLGRDKLHDLTNLQAIFSDAAAHNAADHNPNPNPNPNPATESAPSARGATTRQSAGALSVAGLGLGLGLGL